MIENAISLPLSWKLVNSPSAKILSVDYNKTRWLSLAEIPSYLKPDQTLRLLEANDSKRLVIRGCNQQWAEALIEQGFEAVCLGQEALLDLQDNPFTKKSLRLLTDRALKKGQVFEIPYSVVNARKIELLRSEGVHGQLPQLNHLFRNRFEMDMRAFVFQDISGNWQAALTISRSAVNKMHTELLLRKASAPAGSMESLVQFVFSTLKQEGIQYWSLGEVPFIGRTKGLSFTEQFLNRSGRLLKFAYNYQGLYNFKNKFQPNWLPVYLCAKPAITLPILYTLMIQSNLLLLALKKASQFWLRSKLFH